MYKGHSMALYGSLRFSPFSLICNMTTFSKKNKWLYDPTQGVEDVCKDRIFACMVLYAPFSLI